MMRIRPPSAALWSAGRKGVGLLLRGVLGVCCAALLVLSSAPSLKAAESTGGGIVLERVAVRFSAPETGGPGRPHFIYERELAFEARLLALADVTHLPSAGPYRRHHLLAALESHVAEVLLSALPVLFGKEGARDPERHEREARQWQKEARLEYLDRVSRARGADGEALLLEAAAAEGLSPIEIHRFFRRKAEASLYLHYMVAPMLEPSPAELRAAYAEEQAAGSSASYEEREPSIRRKLVLSRLSRATQNYYQNARSRLKLDYMLGPS